MKIHYWIILLLPTHAFHTLLNSIRMYPIELGEIFNIHFSCSFPKNVNYMHFDQNLVLSTEDKGKQLMDEDCSKDHNTCYKYCYRYWNSCYWESRLRFYTTGDQYSTNSIGEVYLKSIDEDLLYILKLFLESPLHCEVLMSDYFTNVGFNSLHEEYFVVNFSSDYDYSNRVEFIRENVTCVNHNGNAFIIIIGYPPFEYHLIQNYTTIIRISNDMHIFEFDYMTCTHW